MSRHRAPDPQPIARSTEVAALALAGTLAVLALAAAAGLGTASAWFGGGWVWPHDTAHLFTTVAGLLSGHPGRGLPDADAARVPGLLPVYCCVAVAEMLTLAAAATVAVLAGRVRGPNDTRRGMATRGEAARVLGVHRLRRARAVIRPDLYGNATSGTKPQAPQDEPAGGHR